ncbi:MAG: substrate-binding domain-containing protein [Nitrososphaera sp.]
MVDRKLAMAGAAIFAIALVLAAVLLSGGMRQGSHPANQTVVQSASNASNGTKTAAVESKPVEKTPISAVSAPPAAAVVQRWVAQYNAEQNLGTVNAEYSAEADHSSGELYSNVSRFLQSSSADQAIIGYVHWQGTPENDSVILPVSPQAVSVVYNIPSFPDVPPGLKLDAQTLGRILTGNITYWDDNSIKSPNPGANLPHQKIVVVRYNGNTSSTGMLMSYISNGTSEKEVRWVEPSVGVADTQTLASTVQQTPYSIGYADFAYALQAKMTFASLKNSDGEYVLPTTESIRQSIMTGAVGSNSSGPANENSTALQAGSVPPGIDATRFGNGSYPVVGLYYAMFENSTGGNSTSANSTRAAAVDFGKWMVGTEGQRILRDVQYPSVLDSTVLRSYITKEGFLQAH